ncbi:MAG: hypothetical protein UR26_C0001G0076 [candidate division TM6 bacterium GW2011_GWF2_32_72]|nr:MAG: hypothetical protein UR26_C0001G0076 [candidate division TM6 bacterium GW2011_GWF2_32_72]
MRRNFWFSQVHLFLLSLKSWQRYVFTISCLVAIIFSWAYLFYQPLVFEINVLESKINSVSKRSELFDKLILKNQELSDSIFSSKKSLERKYFEDKDKIVPFVLKKLENSRLNLNSYNFICEKNKENKKSILLGLKFSGHMFEALQFFESLKIKNVFFRFKKIDLINSENKKLEQSNLQFDSLLKVTWFENIAKKTLQLEKLKG